MGRERPIKPIETRYAGYRFRSRLEARWAVFFDSLGLHWTYEAEGYELDGVRYLPDFWVKEWDAFVEIKPGKLPPHEQRKCEKLSLASRKYVLIFVGNIGPGEFFVSMCAPVEPGFRDGELSEVFDSMQFHSCVLCESVCLIWHRPAANGAIAELIVMHLEDCPLRDDGQQREEAAMKRQEEPKGSGGNDNAPTGLLSWRVEGR